MSGRRVSRRDGAIAAGLVVVAVGLVASAPGGALVGVARAVEEPATGAAPSAPPGDAAPSGPGTGAAPSAPAGGATTSLVGFAAAAFDEAESPKPTAEEWKNAPEVEPTRRGPRGAGCHVWRVREWVRVSCPDLVTASIAMLGGNPQGMAFWIDPVREGQDGKLPAGGEVMFPVRRGDRRVVQLLSFGPGYEGPFTQLPALVVQESWLDGEATPVLLLH